MNKGKIGCSENIFIFIFIIVSNWGSSMCGKGQDTLHFIQFSIQNIVHNKRKDCISSKCPNLHNVFYILFHFILQSLYDLYILFAILCFLFSFLVFFFFHSFFSLTILLLSFLRIASTVRIYDTLFDQHKNY